jgi:hypothetical protein
MLVPVTLGFPAAKHRMSAPENMTTNAKTMDESASSYCSTLSKHAAHLNKFGKKSRAKDRGKQISFPF